MPRNRAAIFLLFYVFAVSYISLYPWQVISPPHTSNLFWVPFYSQRIILDFLMNILLYIPLGAAATVVFGRKALSLSGAIVFGFAISLGVELTQRYIPLRSATFDDLVANTMGAGLGAIAAFVWKKGLAQGAVIAIFWIVWNGFLLLPTINQAPWPVNGLDADFLWIGTINTFLGFLILTLSLKPKPILEMALALLPAAALWIYPALLLSSLTATFGAFALARWVKPSVIRFIGLACLIWLVFQEFYPFDFGGLPKKFSWIPFENLFSNRPQVYYPAVFGKLFFYTAVVWAVRYQGANRLRAFILPAALLLAGELAQRFLPGRTPELTDLVLMSSGAFMLWLARPAAALSSRWEAPSGVSYQIRGSK